MSAGVDFDALFRRHHDAVLRYAIRRVGPERAGDVASEVFLVAWRRRAEEPVERLPWLLAVARRVVANSLRADDRWGALRHRISSQPAADSADHAEVVSVRDVWARALARLSDDDQELLALMAWDQLSASQAADVLGCSTATLLVRLSRARRRLREQLADPVDIDTDIHTEIDDRKEPETCHAPVEPT